MHKFIYYMCKIEFVCSTDLSMRMRRWMRMCSDSKRMRSFIHNLLRNSSDRCTIY